MITYRQLKLDLGLWRYHRKWHSSQTTDVESRYCPVLGSRRFRQLKRSCYNTAEFADEVLRENTDLLSDPSQVENRDRLLEDRSEIMATLQEALKNIDLCDKRIARHEERAVELTQKFASRELSFGAIASDYGLETAKRIKRRALLAGWLWFPTQTFASQGLAEYLLMMLPGNWELLEDMCVTLSALYYKQMKKRGPTLALIIYWKFVLQNASTHCYNRMPKSWKLAIGTAVTGAFLHLTNASSHWIGHLLSRIGG